MTDHTAPERIWAWPWEVDRSRGQWTLNQSIGFDAEAEYIRADLLERAIQTALEMAATECHRAAYGGQYPQDDQIELGCLRALDNVNAIRVEDVLKKMEENRK